MVNGNSETSSVDDNSMKVRELEAELERLKNNDITESSESIESFNRKNEFEQIIKTANQMIFYHKSEILRLEMVKNGGFPVNYFNIPNLTQNTYKIIHSFALFLSEHKIALESCGVYEMGEILRYFRSETLGFKHTPKKKELLKDIEQKSRIHYGESPIT